MIGLVCKWISGLAMLYDHVDLAFSLPCTHCINVCDSYCYVKCMRTSATTLPEPAIKKFAPDSLHQPVKSMRSICVHLNTCARVAVTFTALVRGSKPSVGNMDLKGNVNIPLLSFNAPNAYLPVVNCSFVSRQRCHGQYASDHCKKLKQSGSSNACKSGLSHVARKHPGGKGQSSN